MTSLLQEKLCEVYTQAPAPKKDFHYLAITKNEVIWKSWQISLRRNQEKILPKELKKTHNDFLLDEQLHKTAELLWNRMVKGAEQGRRPCPDYLKPLPVWIYFQKTAKLLLESHGLGGVQQGPEEEWNILEINRMFCSSMEQVQSIFGKSMLKYALNLCQGHYDFLVRMPENLIVHIMSFLNVEDIEQLSKTCKSFQQLCNTDEFWERIKRLQDKYSLDVQTAKFPAYEKQRNFHQRRGHLIQTQRRQTAFF